MVHQDITVHDLAHEALHEFLHLDGKIFQTLKLLIVKPGALTLEYFRGRRARYISPVRLYLTCSVLFFALSAVAPSNAKIQVTAKDVPSEQIREVTQRAEEAARRVRDAVTHNAPRAMFVLLPFFALLTWSFYRKPQPYYVPHLYYAVHFHAFVFLMFAAAKVLAFGGTAGDAAGGVLSLAVFPYHYIALRRVFGGTRAQLAWKGTAILVLYLLTLAAIFAAVLFVVIKSAMSGLNLHPS